MPNPLYIAFDIETVKEFPDGDDWREHRPLGIACAAAYSEHLSHKSVTWCSTTPEGIADQMTPEDLQIMVAQLCNISARGFTIVTWNGLGFDFDVLAEESGMLAKCRELALDHVDMMFQLFTNKGYALGLSTAAAGMDTTGKTEGMDGGQAVQRWADGCREEVLDYCVQDVRATYELAVKCQEIKVLNWRSRANRPQTLFMPDGWLTVGQAMRAPLPNTEWMTDPIPRSNFTAWLTGPGNPMPTGETTAEKQSTTEARIDDDSKADREPARDPGHNPNTQQDES